MAVGNAVLDVLEQPGFLEGVDAVARRLWDELVPLVKRHPKVLAEVRGAGLMLGLRCSEALNTDLIAALRERGLLTVGAAENVVRLLPPLIINEGHVKEVVAIIEAACESLEKEA
jgi:acetylornithine/N-succinyldiaminopimelate aminotransferase